MQYIRCIQKNGILTFQHFRCYESRGFSTEELIRSTIKKYNITKDLNFCVQTGDHFDGILPGEKLYEYSTSSKNYTNVFPDFVYHSWPQIGINDYNELINKLASINDAPLTNKIGWIGVILCDKRRVLQELSKKHNFLDVIDIEWNRSNPNKLTANSYMTFEDQVKKWKYLIDVGAGGFSARIKILLSSQRICFISDRKYEEWYHCYLKPWFNYVPLKEDLSDLEHNYNIIEGDLALQEFIKKNQRELFDLCLTRESAENKIKEILINEN